LVLKCPSEHVTKESIIKLPAHPVETGQARRGLRSTFRSIRDISPGISPFPGGKGFTLLNGNRLKRVILNLMNSTCTMVITQSPLFNRVKEREDPNAFILSTPTLTLPHRRGRGLSGRPTVSSCTERRKERMEKARNSCTFSI
jgi:hypothetical protein